MQTSGSNLEIQVDNLKVCYNDYGKGEIPIVFIHAFPLDKSSWKYQLDSLKNSFRVIAYDIRGFSKSVPADPKVSINIFADDLMCFMDGLHIKKAIFCGLSMGGYILLNAYKRYPERFHALILSDTQAIADSESAKEKRYNSISQIEKNGLYEFADGFIKKIFSTKTLENNKELVDLVRNTILATPTAVITRTLSALAQRLDTSNVLQEINIPTLILCGREDVITTSEQAEKMRDLIKHSEFHLIDGAGHMPNLEQAEAFNYHLKKFITSVISRTSS